MQRIDGVNIYQNQLQQTGQSASAAGAGRTSGAGQELSGLAKGTVFEGTITEVKDGQVQLTLSNGQSLKAHLEQGVNVRLGEPVLFEVKSNQDGQIMLRQVPVKSSYNPTLLRALTAAGLPANQKNLDMVDTMMRGQLPIDQKSLHEMARMLIRYPNASAETLMQMQKLGFSINEESVTQFEAYKAGEHALVEKFSDMMEQLPELLGKGSNAEDMLKLQNQLLEILEVDSEGQKSGGTNQNPGQTGGIPAEATGLLEGLAEGETLMSQGVSEEAAVTGAGQGVGEEATVTGTGQGVGEETAVTGAGQGAGEEAAVTGASQGAGEEAAAVGEGRADAVLAGQAGGSDGTAAGTAAAGAPVSSVFPEGDLQSLAGQLKQLGMEGDGRLFSGGELNTDLSAKEMLSFIQQNLSGTKMPEASLLKELFSGKEYKGLLKHAMQEQWTLTPEQVAEKENVDRLYERLERQMQKLEQFMQNAGKETPQLARQVTQVRGNLDMMNQINQLYNYVQLPLRLHGQNAHSDLYVYTNKKKLMDKEGELSALLHLDLEYLGTTDVQIKMLGSRVTTNFYLSDDDALRLVEQHIDDLQKRLEEKGYQCSIRLEKQVQETDFVQDFLEREAPLGALQRYSFDVLT